MFWPDVHLNERFQKCLDMFKHKPINFPQQFITAETWIHHYITETKQQSKQWMVHVLQRDENWSINQKGDCDCFGGFSGCGDHRLFKKMQNYQTINGEYYAAMMEQLNDAIKVNHPHLAKVAFLSQCTHSYFTCSCKSPWISFWIAVTCTILIRFSPSDILLFQNLKEWLTGNKFTSNTEVIA